MAPNRRSISESDKALFTDNPTVYSQLPITLPDGVVIQEFATHCAGCSCEIPGDMLRGAVTDAFGVVAIDAIGLCRPCRLSTRFRARFRKDGTWETVNGNGEWMRHTPPRDHAILRVFKTIRKHAKKTFFEACVAAAVLAPLLFALLRRKH